MACSSCFLDDCLHRKSYIISTGVNSGLSDRTETEFCKAILESFLGMTESEQFILQRGGYSGGNSTILKDLIA